MHIAVMIAGIADPKRPLARPASGDWADLIDAPTTPFKLSPFDEAALETALKFRDRDPATVITALVTDGSGDLALMRSVAAYRIDRGRGLRPPAEPRGASRGPRPGMSSSCIPECTYCRFIEI